MLRVFDDLEKNKYLPGDSATEPLYSLDHIDGKKTSDENGNILTYRSHHLFQHPDRNTNGRRPFS